MAVPYPTCVLILLEVLIAGSRLIGAQALSEDYYEYTCPDAEQTVRDIVDRELRKNPSLSAGLLRMHFHDCFVQGCDGSVLIDSTGNNRAEKDAVLNLSLRGFEIIDQAKEALEEQCEGVVSCADVLAMAARDAVDWSGGPYYDVPKGRKDGRRSSVLDTVTIPAPTLNSVNLIRVFGQHGFSAREMVALSGAHTLGITTCAVFKNRLRGFNATHDVDPSLNPLVARRLARACSAGDSTPAPLDLTRTTFDNAYFTALRRGAGVLTSDQTLYGDPATRAVVDAYADDQDVFFDDFSSAMVRLGALDVKDDGEGEVRLNCRRIN